MTQQIMFPNLVMRPGILVKIADMYDEWKNGGWQPYTAETRLFVFGFMRQKDGEICAECCDSLKQYGTLHSFIPVSFLERVE